MRHSQSVPDDLEEIDDQALSGELPHGHTHILKHILGQLRPGVSLSRISLPTFILETRGTLERFTDWLAHADILRSLNDQEDASRRMLGICTWLVAGFHMGPRTPKKPYNSVVGECFRALIQAADGNVFGTYIAEQVSHQPPICAFHYADRFGGFAVWGHCEMRSKFLVHSIAAILDNENSKVNLEHVKRGETYHLNFPDMYGRGILTGKLVMEICGTVRIHCPQSNMYAKIKFLEKPAFRGKYNCFKGRVYTIEGTKKKAKENDIFTFEGRWSAFMRVTSVADKTTWVAFDVRNAVPHQIAVPPDAEQTEMESRHIWKKVTECLSRGDTAKATDHKLALENNQRLLLKYLKDNGREWEQQNFHFDPEQGRYVPNGLNLTPWQDGEPPQVMPPPFPLPDTLAELNAAGVTKSIDAIHSEADGQTIREIRTEPGDLTQEAVQ